MSVPICNRFHTKRSNSGKMTSFQGVPLFDAFVQGEFPHPVARNFVTKTNVLGAAHSKNFVILACTILIQLTSVTDRRTDAQAMVKTREAFCYRV